MSEPTAEAAPAEADGGKAVAARVRDTKSLRELGLWVIIIGPDGKTLNETKNDPS